MNAHLQDYYRHQTIEARKLKDYAAVAFYTHKASNRDATVPVKVDQKRNVYVWYAPDFYDNRWKPELRRNKHRKAKPK